MIVQEERRFVPLVCVVDFHHARGPEVEKWFGVDNGVDPVAKNDWSLLPFLALPDGAHDVEEEFSYFTLCQAGEVGRSPTSLFGIACTRHIESKELMYQAADVTRSSVQKSVVVVVDSPYVFARVRDRLSLVTQAWFAQKDFRDTSILSQFQHSLLDIAKVKNDERDQYVGLSLRETIHDYGHQTLVLFKCALLQPKMLFFGTKCERMCLLQFSLISLIPGLLHKMQDCALPSLSSHESALSMPTSLKTSDRSSLLTYMGLPLQLFGSGAFFGPYTPLQQLDLLSATTTTSYIAGSTNQLVLSNKDRYCDVFVNLDNHAIDFVGFNRDTLRSALALSAADRRWIDMLVRSVAETWDPEDPTRPTTHGYAGSEEFIRLQFEEYTLALLSCVKYRAYLTTSSSSQSNEPDPSIDYSTPFLTRFQATDAHRIFNTFTDPHLFDVIEPRHPGAGGSTVEDLQRRVAAQVAELHLDERIKVGREAIGVGLATGQQRVSAGLNKIWADIEVMRENQRKRAEDRRAAAAATAASGVGGADSAGGSEAGVDVKDNDEDTAQKSAVPTGSSIRFQAPDLSQAQAQVQAASARAGAQVQAVSARAGAYLSSWGSWAAEKRKAYRGGSAESASSTPASESAPDEKT